MTKILSHIIVFNFLQIILYIHTFCIYIIYNCNEVIYLSVLGLIAEYNPFHNGHLYHFNTSMDITQAEYSVCVMSGDFIQRGEPAIADKWARVRMALDAGIDLCIELPVVYCCSSAELFAYGAVSILNSLNAVDYICFGSESGKLDIIDICGDILSNEPQEFKEYLRQYLSEGKSFASSRAKSLVRYMKNHTAYDIDDESLENLLLSPNNILGIEYVKWLKRLDSKIKPVTIKRMHSGYNDQSLKTPMPSASGIRKHIKDYGSSGLEQFMPEYCIKIMDDEFKCGRGPVFMDSFTQAILCILRSYSADRLSDIFDVNEGLEYRIKKASRGGSIDNIVSNIKTRRYTETRINRILIHSLLGMRKDDIMQFKFPCGPQYIRVLGFSEKGKKILSNIKKCCALPIITNAADYRKYDNAQLKRMMQLDITSADIYCTAFKDKIMREGGAEYYKKPEMV